MSVSVDQDIVVGCDAHGVLGCKRLVVNFDLDIGIQIQHTVARRFDFQDPNFVRAVDDLAL